MSLIHNFDGFQIHHVSGGWEYEAEVTNLVTGLSTKFYSIESAARFIGIDVSNFYIG